MSGEIVHTRDFPDYSTLTLWCPGCQIGHTISVGGVETWTWDGDRERPTISPSILAWPRDTLIDRGLEGDALTDRSNVRRLPRCHSFVRLGRWEFLGDSEHDLAGQTVDVQPFPGDWGRG
jgi:hypothetical protein